MSNINLEEFNDLVKFISDNHGFRSHKRGGKMIKYVRCSFDTRFNDIFSIQLDDKIFSVVNENRKRDLKKWLYSYLNDTDDGFDPIRDDPEIDWGNLMPELKARAKQLRTTNGITAPATSAVAQTTEAVAS